MRPAVHIDANDNVWVALRPLTAGSMVDGLLVASDVPTGHKIAARPIPAGRPVIKYGYPIGVATRDIAAGEHVHVHNVASMLQGRLDSAEVPHAERAPSRQNADQTFMGFRRSNGRVAIRNEIWIINTVGCVNKAAEEIARRAREQLVRPGSTIEGVYAFPHPFGCSQLGNDLEATQKILAGLINHPHAAAVLVLGLGCENNQLATLLEHAAVDSSAEGRLSYFNAQDCSDEVDEGVQRVLDLARYAGRFQRQSVPLSELMIGMKCGGSDGLSGITANPLVGRISDRLAAIGGTVLLTEVPEMFGAEDVLLERAISPDVAQRTVTMVNDFRSYFQNHGQPIDENPAPGNKAGGISTLAEKSLGCVQKAGQAPIAQVLAYGQTAPRRLGGVGLINAPGNDGVSSTALVAAGANLVLFTTGRGTPMGFPAPTIKISTNSSLAERKPGWIDFDAGPIALGTRTFEELEDELLKLIVDVASGAVQTKSECNGIREISIWKDGVTL